MVKRMTMVGRAFAGAFALLAAACQPTTPRTTPQREADAVVAAAAAAAAASSGAAVQPRTYGTAEYLVRTKATPTAPLVVTRIPTSAPNAQLAAERRVTPAAIKAIETPTLHRAEAGRTVRLDASVPQP